MEPAQARQKLTAVFVTDVVGYSRLMAEDHHATVQTLAEYREVFSTNIEQFQGRVVNAPGDSILAEFESVVEAVNCAVEVQRELAVRNEKLPGERRMHFRIGVNLGDVLVREGELFGDGVNIAARLEALADPGGICISRTVYDQVKSRLPSQTVQFEYLGEQQVKNIPEPVRAYKALIGTGAAPHIPAGLKPGDLLRWRRTALVLATGLAVLVGLISLGYYLSIGPGGEGLPLPDEPSIVVLPFENLSGDPEQDYFAAGISKGIVTQLYRIPGIFVIHRQSSLPFAGKAASVEEVGRKLGVRYVLEGSVQKSGERVRVTTLLISAPTGRQLWAESYDRDWKEILAVQDEITRKVVTELGAKLSMGDWLRYMSQATDNIQAFDLYFQADMLYTKGEREANAKARQLLQQAVELDPKFARAVAFLGWTHISEYRYGWSENPERSKQLAREFAERSLAMDDRVYLGHALLSSLFSYEQQYENAVAAAQRAVESEPNNAIAILIYGVSFLNAGQPAEALAQLSRAKRHSPFPQPYFYTYTGISQFFQGQYDDAAGEFRKFLAVLKKGGRARRVRMWLIATEMERGREAQAREEVAEFLKHEPQFNLRKAEELLEIFPFKDRSFIPRILAHLRAAGLPE